MKNVKPYPFEKLPKVSKQEARLIASLQEFFPRIGFSDELGRAIKILINRELGLPFSYHRERLTTVNPAEKVRSFSRQGVYLLFGLPPAEQKGVLDIDPLIAQMAIDRLLGGTEKGGRNVSRTMVGSLTEIEEGVLSYLFLKIFALIFDRCGKSARVHFRMEGFCSSPEELLGLFRGVEKGEPVQPVVYASYHISLGERAGYARLILPVPLAQKVFLDPVEGGDSAGEKDMAYYGARLANLGFLPLTVWTELGRTLLKVKEINALEAGDVIVLDKTQARVEGGRLTGHLPVRFGAGETGSIRGAIVPDLDRLRVRLEGLELEQQA